MNSVEINRSKPTKEAAIFKNPGLTLVKIKLPSKSEVEPIFVPSIIILVKGIGSLFLEL
jgi:hypothetical protein